VGIEIVKDLLLQVCHILSEITIAQSVEKYHKNTKKDLLHLSFLL
jgi:hypothetical protein